MTLEARLAIEALRAGVPNRAAIRRMGVQAPALGQDLAKLLDTVWAGDGREPGFGVAGGFGAGKSHLLGYLAEAARLRGFVVSRVVVSKETPLNLPAVFAAAVGHAELPDSMDDPISTALAHLRDRPSDLAALEEFVSAPSSGFSDVFAAVLLLLQRAPLPETVRRIERFVGGAKISDLAVKKALREAGARGAFKVAHTDPVTLLEQRVAFMARLFRAAGYSGWCILLDEVELVGRYGPLQRATAYAWLARWLGLEKANAFPGVAVAYAITEDFASAVIAPRLDDEKLPDKLRAKGRTHDARLALAAIKHIEGTIRRRSLPSPSDASLRAGQEHLRQLYEEAYGWTPPELPIGQRTGSMTMRQFTKAWVTQWDLLRLSGESVGIEAGTVASNYEETGDLDAPPPAEEDAE
jgi:hypothetical protein